MYATKGTVFWDDGSLPQRSTRRGGREIVIMFIIGHVEVLRSEDESL